jgi:2-polyprenyl-3-methyl-5-hydroxy-6-metoxy-1,4-benzoquinol methylase
LIVEAVKTGMHSDVSHSRTAIGQHVPGNVAKYSQLFNNVFADIWQRASPITWLDVGAGYGEVVEAVTGLAPAGSKIEGVEPMTPKVIDCQRRGLNVREAYLSDIKDKYDVVSAINVFSHIPDFHFFLKDVKRVLLPNGEVVLETGNIGDLDSVEQVPTELDLPDHLVFAGERNMESYLLKAGFHIVSIERQRRDTVGNFLKNIIKKFLGRKVMLRLPYTSPYRSLLVRAKLGQ